MTKHNWRKFIEATKKRKPILLLQKILKNIPKNGVALDLGCGAGVEVKYLAERGFKVTAVDKEKSSINWIKKSCKGLPVNPIREDVVKYRIQPNSFDIIIAWNLLPFIKKESALKVLSKIQVGLKKKGYFVFSLFGPKDGFSPNKNMSFFEVAELKNLLPYLKFLKLLELKKESPGVLGKIKFWHLIQGIAQKKD